MDARKLVGMTQGARKRKARWESSCISLPWRRAWRAKHGETLRIGQRLRPCPNCMKCWPWTRFENGRIGALAPPVGAGKRYMRLELDDICDGSGVIPAKARKVRR